MSVNAILVLSYVLTLKSPQMIRLNTSLSINNYYADIGYTLEILIVLFEFLTVRFDNMFDFEIISNERTNHLLLFLHLFF